MPLPYCDAVSRRDETKKTIINEAFGASIRDITTHYNDIYCLLRRINITMSAFVSGETTNKHFSTPLKTRV